MSSGTNHSLIGRLGVQAAYVIPVSSAFVLQPFTGISTWRNFQNDSHVNYTGVGGGTNLAAITSSARDFRQYATGVAFAAPTLNMVGYLQGTWRDGNDISGATVTGGGRINF